MQRPPIPPDEQRRLAALHALELLDSEPEAGFDRITRLAAKLFDVPVAVVSLVGADREWFKSHVGLDACQGSRDESFCGHTILTDETFVVEDTAADPRFQDNPQVAEQGIRFYAGHPLRAADGSRIGAFCIKDTRPRTLDDEQLEQLRDLAAIVDSEIRLIRTTQMQREMCRLAERAESASRAKSEFLANMSHELRTPLNSVIGFSNILLKNKHGRFEHTDLGYVERVRDNGTHLLELIDGVLDISKVEAGQIQFKAEEVDVAAIVRETVGRLEGAAAGKQLALVVDVPDGLDPLHADALRLRQVLINLVGNAIKFTERGSVTVRVVADDCGSGVGRIEVIDTGIGIRPERLPQVFEPFTQDDTSASRRHGGAGLGLTISDALCRIMGFRIDVTSEPGHGSTFVIRTDRQARKRADAESTLAALPVEPEVGHGPFDATVLVIDDDPDARHLMAELLRDRGCQVLTATDGAEGLRIAGGPRTPDLITLDLMMPGMNGWDVLQELKRDPRLADVPVAVCSIVGPDNASTLFDAVEILEKPIRPEKLASVIDRHVRPAPQRVLVVDDTEDSRVLLTSIFDDLGIESVTATNGLEALDVLRRESVDCVVLDLMMPVMDGFKFLERLRAIPKFASLPVFVVSAKDIDGSERIRLDDHVVAILPKGASLAASLTKLLSGWARSRDGAGVA